MYFFQSFWNFFLTRAITIAPGAFLLMDCESKNQQTASLYDLKIFVSRNGNPHEMKKLFKKHNIIKNLGKSRPQKIYLYNGRSPKGPVGSRDILGTLCTSFQSSLTRSPCKSASLIERFAPELRSLSSSPAALYHRQCPKTILCSKNSKFRIISSRQALPNLFTHCFPFTTRLWVHP